MCKVWVLYWRLVPYRPGIPRSLNGLCTAARASLSSPPADEPSHTFNSSFGHKILTLKPLVKLIPTIMEHKDKIVREEAKSLIVELHRWIGAAIKAHLSSLKPVQVGL